jgi:hypothetical protein
VSTGMWGILIMILAFAGIVWIATNNDGSQAVQESSKRDSSSRITITITAKGPLFASFHPLHPP